MASGARWLRKSWSGSSGVPRLFDAGFQVVAAVDIDESLVGKTVDGIEIENLADLSSIVRDKEVRVAILAVPAHAAEKAVEAIVESGITGILNFAPVTLSLPKNVGLVEVDLARELEQLAFTVLQNDDS